MKTEIPDLVDLMEWGRFAEERKTLLEALTILNNRHRQAIAGLNQRLIERQESFQAQLIRIEDEWRSELRGKNAQIFALRKALTDYEEAFCDGPENCSLRCYEEVSERAKEALSAPPPAVVALEDVGPLIEAAENTRHYGTTFNPETGKTEGVIVSANSFWKLKESLGTFTAKHESLTAKR